MTNSTVIIHNPLKHLPIKYSELNGHLFFTSQMSFFSTVGYSVSIFFLFHIIFLDYITDSYILLSKM